MIQVLLSQILLDGALTKLQIRSGKDLGTDSNPFLNASKLDFSVPERISLDPGREDVSFLTFGLDQKVEVKQHGVFVAKDRYDRAWEFKAYVLAPYLPENPDLMKDIAKQWIARRDSMIERGVRGYKPGTQGHADRELEYWIGATACAEASGIRFNSGILMLLAAGRGSEELLK